MQNGLTSPARPRNAFGVVRRLLSDKERGRRIAAKRKEKRWTQEELADEIAKILNREPPPPDGRKKKKPHGSTVSKWEAGRMMELENLLLVEEALGVTKGYLTYSDDEAAPPQPSLAEELDDIEPARAARWIQRSDELLEALRARAGELGNDTPKPAPARRVKPPPPYSGMRELEPPYERAKPKPRRKRTTKT